MRDVVENAGGKVVLRLRFFQFVEDGQGHRRGEFLGRETVAAAGHARKVRKLACPRFGESRHHVHVERFAHGAGLFCAVEHGDGTDGRGKRGHQGVSGERAIEPDLQQADLFTLREQRLNGFFHCAGSRSHQRYDPFRIGRAYIVEQVVLPADAGREAVHHVLHNCGAGAVEGIAGLARLEEHIGVLCRATKDGMVGRQGAFAVVAHAGFFQQDAQVIIAQFGDAIDFVRSPEAVEEVQEGHSGGQRSGLHNQGKVRSLLDGIRSHERKARLAGSHHVAVISENRERVRGHGTRGHVDHRGRQLPGDFVHVGDHQQKPLRGREGAAEGASLDGAVQGAGCAPFALHFDDARNTSPDVRLVFRHPLVGQFAHGRGRSDGINRDDLVEAVGHPGGGLVAVHN